MTELRVKGAELAETLELPKPEKTRIDRWNLTALGSYKQQDCIDINGRIARSHS